MKRPLTLQNSNRSGTKLDDPVLACFGRVFVNSIHTGFGHRQRSPDLIEVPNSERNSSEGRRPVKNRTS